MTQEQIDEMTVSDWVKLFESNEIQPGTIDLNSDDPEEGEAQTGTVNLFKD